MAKEKFDFIQPFKDIPKTLKGFPKNIVHIWKDPVNNSAEIKVRKAEIYPYMYLFVGLFLIFAILCAVIPAASTILSIFGVVFGFGVVICVFLLSVMNKAQRKFSDLECPNCKERIAYSPDVNIEVSNKSFYVTKESRAMSGSQSAMVLTVSGKEIVKAKITCKCQKCGTEKTFEQTFTTVECERFQNNVHYTNSATLLAQFEQDVRAEGDEGFEGKSGTTARGVKIKYNRNLKSLVIGYFGNEIQMR
jgi:hypothetical protein